MNGSEFERELYKYRVVRTADYEGRSPVKPVVGPEVFARYALQWAQSTASAASGGSGETVSFIVRPLKGKEHVVQALLSESVLDIKRKLEGDVGLPPASQSLVYKGKPLQDSLTLAECNIEPNARVNLIARANASKGQPATVSPSATATDAATNKQTHSDNARDEQTADFWVQLGGFLRSHFSAEDAEKVLKQFRGEHDARISALSLDDIDRLARDWADKRDR